jgi:hypothetical protein
MMKSIFYSYKIVEFFSTSGVREALPMGVAPEAIVEFYFLSIGSKISCMSLQCCYRMNTFTLYFFYRVHDQCSRWE